MFSSYAPLGERQVTVLLASAAWRAATGAYIQVPSAKKGAGHELSSLAVD
jgi:hypothetical protein